MNVQKPDRLFLDEPDWTPRYLYDGESRWECELAGGLKAHIWATYPIEMSTGKLSKSDQKDEEVKLTWDGICSRVRGGPEPARGPGSILAWLRRGIVALREKEAQDGDGS